MKLQSKKRARPLSPPTSDLIIVAVGASAGGLEAYTTFLQNLPIDTGMAYILIQHLDPTHSSLSTELLVRTTEMPVTEVTHNLPVQANHVYVMPPNREMTISQGLLKLTPRLVSRGVATGIDFFFKSLAEDKNEKAIGVILSGTGNDGNAGLQAIKFHGGVTMVQEPTTAKFKEMPESAIASAEVDYVLPLEKMGTELAILSKNPFLNHPEQFSKSKVKDEIFQLLKSEMGLDFSDYKASTVERRIARRMEVRKITRVKEYFTLLKTNREERKLAYTDLLIHVTEFFRDTAAFETLSKKIIPHLLKQKPPEEPVRIWVSGCSTGEEVYSVAICFLEYFRKSGKTRPLQLFASDVSEPSLQKARAGIYPKSISNKVSAELLSRYFVEIDGCYKISKQVRDLCLFSKHDLTTDPPFARIDLITCRNVMIYFSSLLQKRIIPIFHFALKPNGVLWLGHSETVGTFEEMFSSIDKPNKFYRKKDFPDGYLRKHFLSNRYLKPITPSLLKPEPATSGNAFSLDKEVDRALLLGSNPTLVINDHMEILQFRGKTNPYVEPPPGRASFNIFKMIRPEILSPLRMSIQFSKKSKKTIVKKNLKLIEDHGKVITFNLRVIPIAMAVPAMERHYLIQFERVDPSNGTKEKNSKKKTSLLGVSQLATKNKILQDKIRNLELELSETQKYQNSLAQDFEGAHEQLATTNEEFQSTNEELQSSNEELETAKEELQATNEELITVNEEFRANNLQLNQTNNDLINLLGSVEIPILMVGADHCIRRFTPNAAKALNLLSSDMGRPLKDISNEFHLSGKPLNLEKIISQVMGELKPTDLEIQDASGHWYRIQVKPYRTIDNKVDGVVIAIVNIDVLKQSMAGLGVARDQAESLNRSKDMFLATLSHELRTPLTTILSWSEMLLRGKLDPSKTKRGLEVINASGKAQAELINDILDVSRIILGKLSLDLRDIDPNLAVVAAVELVTPLAETKGVQIVCQLDSQVGFIKADLLRLKQVIWNLLTNSIKFSNPSSQIIVSLKKVNAEDAGSNAKMVQIQVADSGKGMPKEYLPKVFDAFSQADSSSIRMHGGLGLGLAIVKNLVGLLSGTIRAESEGLGKGSTFTVNFPLLPELQSSAPQARDAKITKRKKIASEVRLQGVKVLVVDDQADAREIFQEILESYGAEVKVASSSEEAYKIFQAFRPHVLMSDIAMPDENGYSFIKRIRSLSSKKGGKTPAVAVTAFANSDDIECAFAAGFQSHVAKPVESDYLANVIYELAQQLND